MKVCDTEGSAISVFELLHGWLEDSKRTHLSFNFNSKTNHSDNLYFKI